LPSKNIIHSAKLRPTFAEARSLGSLTTVSRFICRASVTGSARWYPA
jgi:hypothetical protein